MDDGAGRLAALRQPHVARVLTTSLLARMPTAMGTLVILLLLAPRHGYAIAGLCCTAYVAASALTSPLLARWVDRYGARRVIVPAACGNATGFLLLALLPRDALAAQFAAAVVGGLSLPPISPTARGLWPRLLPPDMLPLLYGLDATLQEVIYITGPALVAIVSGLAGPRAAAAVVSAVGLAGGIAFAAAPVFAAAPAGGPGRRLRIADGLLLAPWLLLAGSLVMAFSMDEVAVVAFVSPGKAGGTITSGLVLAAWSAGSMVGGVVIGSRQGVATDRSTLLGCLAMGAALAVVVVAPGPIALAVLLFATGWLIAPGLSRIYQRISAAAPAGSQTEAFGWLAVAFILGAAVGASAGGGCVTALGARAALGLAALPPVLATGLAGLMLRPAHRGSGPPSPAHPEPSDRPVVSAP